MIKIIALALSLIAAGAISAHERPISSCEKAPLLTYYQKQLPDYILGAAADTEPKIQSKIPYIAIPILKRANSRLVCIVVVLDETGKAKDLAVSYPAGFRLTDNEREQILALQWSAAEVAGQPRPSLANIDLELR
ncbi:MAG: hypothetical protein WBG33_11500 [Rhodanobacter sp.]